MCEKDWDCSLGMTGGFLEEFGGEGRITMEASASSQMQVTATPSPSEAEIPPAPDVACGMVRRARGVKRETRAAGSACRCRRLSDAAMVFPHSVTGEPPFRSLQYPFCAKKIERKRKMIRE